MEAVATNDGTPRADKGKRHRTRKAGPTAGGALSSVLIAIQDLPMADAKRVLMAAALFAGIKLIETSEKERG